MRKRYRQGNKMTQSIWRSQATSVVFSPLESLSRIWIHSSYDETLHPRMPIFSVFASTVPKSSNLVSDDPSHTPASTYCSHTMSSIPEHPLSSALPFQIKLFYGVLLGLYFFHEKTRWLPWKDMGRGHSKFLPHLNHGKYAFSVFYIGFPISNVFLWLKNVGDLLLILVRFFLYICLIFFSATRVGFFSFLILFLIGW